MWQIILFLTLWRLREYSVDAFFGSNINVTVSTNRNISCYDQGLPRPVYLYTSYCVIYEGRNTSNGTITYQYFILNQRFPLNPAYQVHGGNIEPKQYGWIRMSRIRCSGFSNLTDIGFGPCAPLPYEIFAIGTFPVLCICDTMDCNMNMSACQASVISRSSSSPPAPLSPLLASFSTPITCVGDTASTNLILANSFCLRVQGMLPPTNGSACLRYLLNHTVLCRGIHVVNGTGFYPPVRSGFAFEDYDSNFDDWWLVHRYFYSVGLMNMIIYEGAGNMAFIIPSFYIVCYCTANNCNVDLNTCASGLNINISLAFGNSMVSSVSTTSTIPILNNTNASTSIYLPTTFSINTTNLSASTTTLSTTVLFNASTLISNRPNSTIFQSEGFENRDIFS